MPPAVSVIIPALNEAAELPATLDSVAAAIGPAAELIVVDGGSDDGTVERARGRAQLIASPTGRGRQLNAGARAAGGEVFLFLHADTWLDPGAGPALAAALAEPRVVGGCFKVSLRGPSSRRPIARLLATAINLRSRWLRSATGDQAIFVRRDVFEELGGFPEHELFEDVLFYRRLRRCGALALLEPPVRTSDRRWLRRGYARTIATHLILRALLLIGVSPTRLARLYRSVR